MKKSWWLRRKSIPLRHMKRRKTLTWIVAAAIALVAGGVWAVRHDRAMHAALRELQAQNQADTIFRSDSAAQVLVDYFDHPWHSSNTRVLAHYLLGRAHADMGEAPQAIEDYQTAVECADTTDQDCDYRLLRNVYGQMAEVFHAQNLPEDELKADSAFIRYSWMIGDTLQAINGYRAMECPYFLLNRFDIVQTIDSTAHKTFLALNDTIAAARALLTSAFINANNQDYNKVKDIIIIICREADIYDDNNRLRHGYEMFYYTLGLYHEGIGQLDSAEYYYRQLLPAKKYEACYKGLLSVYSKRCIADSIAKYAPLYADANDASHDSLRTAEVHKTASPYNYNRHLRIAQDEQQKSQRRKTFIFFLLAAIVILCIIGWIVIQRRRKKETELSLIITHIQEDLRRAAEKYSKTKEDLHLAESQLQDYVTTKQNEINELYDQQQQLKMLYESLKSKDKRALYYSSKAVLRIRFLAQSRKDAMSDSEWEDLKTHFQYSFSHFCRLLEQRGIAMTENEWKVCILLDLGLTTDDIAALMKQSAQRISNLKAQTNNLLFHERTGSKLSQNLRFAIHPEEKDFS